MFITGQICKREGEAGPVVGLCHTEIRTGVGNHDSLGTQTLKGLGIDPGKNHPLQAKQGPHQGLALQIFQKFGATHV